MVRLLFHSDDFGKSHAVNQAILEAHTSGLLSSASLMVTGEAFHEAVDLARRFPKLKVGLHLALSEARPILPQEQISELVQSNGCFPFDPAVAGLRLALYPKARKQAVAEIAAQFDAFASTGLPFTHVDGHHHLHMHPFLFDQCVVQSQRFGVRRIRVVEEFGWPLPPRRDFQNFLPKLTRHFIFAALAESARSHLRRTNLETLDGVLGLWETGRITENYLLQTLPQIPAGDWEIYAHMDSKAEKSETSAFTSPAIRHMVEHLKIELL